MNRFVMLIAMLCAMATALALSEMCPEDAGAERDACLADPEAYLVQDLEDNGAAMAADSDAATDEDDDDGDDYEEEQDWMHNANVEASTVPPYLYRWLHAERIVHAYTMAMQRAITPQSHVLVLGSAMGFLSLVAAKLGAKSVTAIEDDWGAYSAAQAVIKANQADYAKRIRTLYKQDILSVRLRDVGGTPDVVVSAHVDARLTGRGLLAFVHHLIDSGIMPKGTSVIPRNGRIYAQLVHTTNGFAERVADIDFTAASLMRPRAQWLAEAREVKNLSDLSPAARINFASGECQFPFVEFALDCTGAGTADALRVTWKVTLGLDDDDDDDDAQEFSFSGHDVFPETFFGLPDAVQCGNGASAVRVAMAHDYVNQIYVATKHARAASAVVVVSGGCEARTHVFAVLPDGASPPRLVATVGMGDYRVRLASATCVLTTRVHSWLCCRCARCFTRTASRTASGCMRRRLILTRSFTWPTATKQKKGRSLTNAAVAAPATFQRRRRRRAFD